MLYQSLFYFFQAPRICYILRIALDLARRIKQLDASVLSDMFLFIDGKHKK